MGRTESIEFTELRCEYNKKLADVIFGLMDQKGIDQSMIYDAFRERHGVELSRGRLSLYKNKPGNNIPFIILLEICDLLKISATELFQMALGNSEVPVESIEEPTVDKASKKGTQIMTISIPASDGLITNSKCRAFGGYWGSYFTYFTPTHSGGDNILKGKLILDSKNESARARFELATGENDENGEEIVKVYEGAVIYSSNVKCCYCILSSEKVGELCFIMFRHFYINDGKLECRLAEAMTASAGREDKYPTVHRMLISREAIRDEDLCRLKAMLSLTNSEIIIPKKEVEKLIKDKPEYTRVIDRVLSPETKTVDCYRFRENSLEIAVQDIQYGKKRDAIPIIMALRQKAISYRYNKIGRKADTIVREYLRQLGYYRRGKDTNRDT